MLEFFKIVALKLFSSNIWKYIQIYFLKLQKLLYVWKMKKLARVLRVESRQLSVSHGRHFSQLGKIFDFAKIFKRAPAVQKLYFLPKLITNLCCPFHYKNGVFARILHILNLILRRKNMIFFYKFGTISIQVSILT